MRTPTYQDTISIRCGTEQLLLKILLLLVLLFGSFCSLRAGFKYCKLLVDIEHSKVDRGTIYKGMLFFGVVSGMCLGFTMSIIYNICNIIFFPGETSESNTLDYDL